MDTRTLFIILPALQLVVLGLLLTFYYTREKRDKSLRFAIVSASILATSLLLYFFRVVNEDKALSVVSIYLGIVAVVLLARAISEVYSIKPVHSIWKVFVYTLVFLITYSISMYFEQYFLNVIIIQVATIINIMYIFRYLRIHGSIKSNPLFYQSVFYLLMAILRAAFAVRYFDVISFTNNPTSELIFSAVSIMTINIMTITLLIEISRDDLSKLQSSKRLVETSLLKVKKLSETDQLTELMNRRKLNAVLESLYNATRNYEYSFSIILIDVNNFKVINDTYGHTVGDEVLKYISRFLEKSLRDGDYISRWGGDEFMIILPNSNTEVCKHVISKLENLIDKDEQDIVNEKLSLSFGYAFSSNQESLEKMVIEADKTMYKDKFEKKKT